MSTGLLCSFPDYLKGINILTTYPDDFDASLNNGTALEDDDGWTGNPHHPRRRLWSDCDKMPSKMLMSSHGGLASALGAVAVTVLVSLLIVAVLIYVVRKSVRLESLNLPGQVRYVRGPPSKDEDEHVIMDMRWATVSKEGSGPGKAAVILNSRALSTEYTRPKS
ncbi:uncharacterized protein [Hetaerina americana]|uniref:uncharacterized protein n=1 Tax=Hetaerina americana TaxID=62018 RepID=UPI003A7F3DA1